MSSPPPPMNDELVHVGVVVIGRNEGERLRRCLNSVASVAACVYVDSGSTDGSVALARGLGVSVIQLTSPPRFTAARARNAGLRHLLAERPDLVFVQLVDGDCELQPVWLASGLKALQAESDLALVFGRRRERYPARSVYNALCDDEWNVPIGYAPVAGGDILCRVAALRAIGGYREDMIAGEDPDMALRLRAVGWRLRRIEVEMTLHDAAIFRFGQWWRRMERSGHAFAELAERHPTTRQPDWRHLCRSIVVWALVTPIGFVSACAMAPLQGTGTLIPAVMLLLLWPAKMARIAAAKRRLGLDPHTARAAGILMMIGKFPELQGLIRFYVNRLLGRRSHLIEYKGANST